jgi:hypothetical protein
MSKRLLLDNDFILKISTLDLVKEFLQLPLVHINELRHLSSLPFMIKKGKLQNHTDEGLKRAFDWIATFPVLEAPSPHSIDRIPLLPGIDPGERLLLGSVLELVESVIFTGDKRCIHAIGGLSAELQDVFTGRILCLEAAIRAIVEVHDFDFLAHKVRPGLSCDKALGSIFGNSKSADSASVLEGLSSYINSLASAPGGNVLLSWEELL